MDFKVGDLLSLKEMPRLSSNSTDQFGIQWTSVMTKLNLSSVLKVVRVDISTYLCEFFIDNIIHTYYFPKEIVIPADNEILIKKLSVEIESKIIELENLIAKSNKKLP